MSRCGKVFWSKLSPRIYLSWQLACPVMRKELRKVMIPVRRKSMITPELGSSRIVS
jgi:hypothetical protein